MTYDEAMGVAKANPGHGVREKLMQARWKIIYIKWPKLGRRPAGGDFFCINPITGSSYQYHPSDADKASHKWSHA